MERQKPRRYLVYDPLLNRVVSSTKQWGQTTALLRDGWEKANGHWAVCTLCWRQTEFSEQLLKARRFRRASEGTYEAVPPPDRVRIERWARKVTAWYEAALRGAYGQFAAAKLVTMFCDIRDAEGETRSLDEFYDAAEQRLRKRQWAKLAPYPERLYWPEALSELAGEGSSRDKLISQARYPSQIYCEGHNPNRSEAARARYQRDRRPATIGGFRRAYEEFRAATCPGAWMLDDIVQLRRFAYVASHAKRHHALRHLVAARGFSIAKAGELLGISRQAASASLARHPNAICPAEEAALVDDLLAIIRERANV